ncbi:MAG: hypothetical protein AABX14_03815 [Candidatus Aenigmatarchaeota archaeon]
MEYDRFRVRSPVKSFRDLEVYQKTVQLSSEIALLAFVDEKQKEEMTKTTARIPELIAEAYGDKYDSKELSKQKLTEAVTLITDMITKIDILREKFKDEREKKETLDSILSRYHTQKIKVLNLRKAWDRVYNYGSTNAGKQ